MNFRDKYSVPKDKQPKLFHQTAAASISTSTDNRCHHHHHQYYSQNPHVYQNGSIGIGADQYLVGPSTLSGDSNSGLFRPSVMHLDDGDQLSPTMDTEHPLNCKESSKLIPNQESCWSCSKEQLFCCSPCAECCNFKGNTKCSGLHDSSHTCHTCHIRKSAYSHGGGQHLDNSSALLQRLAQLFDSPDLSDVQLIVGPHIYYAHKVILSCASEVFSVMLTNPTWPDSHQARVVLQEEDDCVEVFNPFLRYLYTGTIHLDHNSVLPVLMLADKYHVIDLQQVCINYMCEHMVSTIKYNRAVSWLQYARISGHSQLAHNCHSFINNNFHKVVCTRDFLNMDRDTLADFLHDSRLVIHDEHTLYRGLLYWIENQQNKADNNVLCFNDMMLIMLSHIRFPMMLPAQLCQLDKDPIAGHFHSFFMEQIGKALQYHSAISDDRQASDHFGLVTEPRNFTNEMWRTSLCIDNFSCLAEHDVRPLVFSTPKSGSEAEENHSWEWSMDVFPKGIQFQKCIMIGLFRNLELNGAIYNTVRLVLESKSDEKRHVDIAVLVTGVQDHVEYTRRVIQKRCIFDKQNRTCLFNDLVPYDELNSMNSPYLSGLDGDVFKISIIIKPI